MTSLAKRKSKLIFTTSDTVRERGRLREVIVEAASPYHLRVRLAGLRTSYELSFAGLYQQAVRVEVERRKAEKKARKR